MSSDRDQLNNSLTSDKYSPRHIKVEASPPKGVKDIDLDKLRSSGVNPEHHGERQIDVVDSEMFNS